MTLRRITDGYVLEGNPVDKPPAATNPYTTQAGTEFWPVDGSAPEITQYNGLGQIVWGPFPGLGGPAVTIGTTGAPLQLSGGPAYVLDFGFAGEADGDLVARVGGAWVRLAAGAPGDVLTVVAGLPAWAPPAGGGVTVAGGDGIGVTGGPAYTVALSLAGQADGDLIARVGGAWVRLAAGAAGQVLTVVAGAPAWAPNPAGVTLTGSGGVVVTGGPAYNAEIGVLGQTPGDLLYFDGTSWTRLPPGNTFDQLQTFVGFPVWQPSGASQNYDVYVAGTTGNDGNTGRTPAQAVRTLNRAMQNVPDSITGTVIIHCAPEPILETSAWNWLLPGGHAPDGKLILIDAPVVELLPAEANTGGTTGLLNAFGTILATSVLVPNAYNGRVLQYLTAGVNQGMYRIATNDAGTITIVGQFPGPVTLGDTFRVVEESVTVTLPPAIPGDDSCFIGGAGFGLEFSGINFDLNGRTLIANTVVLFNVCSSRGTTGQWIFPGSGQLSGPAGAISPTPSIGTQPRCGGDLATTIICTLGGRASYGNSRLSAVFLQTGGSSSWDGVYATGDGSFQIRSGRLDLTSANSLNCTQTAFVYLKANASAALSGVDVSNANVDGISVDGNSFCELLFVTGTGNTQYGLSCYRHSRVQCSDASVTTTITGASGDVQVGSNLATSTWVQIAANNVADVTDLTATTPTLAAVST